MADAPTPEQSSGVDTHRNGFQGVVKTYDPVTGIGVVVSDDGNEIPIRPGALAGSIFRFVRQGQRIVFEIADGDGGPSAVNVRIGQEGY